DRDGNPYVTHEITLRVAARLQQTLMRCYHRDVRFLKRRLTFHGVDEIIARVERKIYPLAYGNPEDGYRNASELLGDLAEARASLIEDHRGLFLDLLDSFVLKVRIFGFHFASMDIRQDSRKHTEVWNVILKKLQRTNKKLKGFTKKNGDEQVRDLLRLKFKPEQMRIKDPFVSELLESIRVIGKIQEMNGEQGCHRYVISNCQSAHDIIRVFQLAKVLLSKKNRLALDIVPLFETIEDLSAAPEVMDALYRIPEYREHLRQRGNKQTI